VPDALKVLRNKTIVLDIPDNFGYNDPKLIKLLEEQVNV
jgi:predicted protein tyrosine phosphatase